MVDPLRALQPLDEAEAAIRKLRLSETPVELAAALRAAHRAVERALRLLLSSDPVAADALGLTGLAAEDLSFDRLLHALRQRGIISIEMGGIAHELQQAADRAAAQQPTAADAELAQRAVSRLRAEIHALGDQPVRTAAHQAVEEGAVEEPLSPVPPPRRGRSLLVGIAVAIAALVVVFFIIGRLADGTAEAMGEATAHFRAGRLDDAEAGFQEVLEHDPENVSALLYLGRIHRRQNRYEPAAERLREAARLAPEDADVRRELGHLFADLGRPQEAIEQYRRAVELEPEASANWLALVRALRAIGSPEADDWLRRAPPEVQAALGGPPSPA